MAEKVKLSDSAVTRGLLKTLMAEEGLDGLCKAAKLVALAEAREATREADADRWKARARFLSNMITMTERVER